MNKQDTSSDSSTSFKPVTSGGQVQSGEMLLIQAYAAMWLLAFALILSSLKKQRKLDADIDRLRLDLAKVRDGGDGGDSGDSGDGAA